MINTTCSKTISKNDIKNYFLEGIKSSSQIGIEYEKIGVLSSNFAVPFNIMENLLEKLSEFENYKRVITKDGNLIGLTNDISSISLEPGAQFELSVSPQNTLKELEMILHNHNELISMIAKDLGISWLSVGLQPASIYDDIQIIPKKRYELMTNYLPTVGELPLVMMRETAGIQVGIDYNSQEDAINKLSLSLKLAPIVSAVYANSPIRDGKLTGLKSYRAYAWTKTDEQRCGLISKKLFDNYSNYSFDDYVNDVSNIPMIMIDINGEQYPISNFNFDKFINFGYNGKFPSINDFLNHLSLTFTDTRLKQYLEIRNHDSQKQQFIMSIPAFWKSVMYDSNCFKCVSEIVQNFTYEEFAKLRLDSPIYALDAKIGKYSLKEIAKEIFEAAYFSLKNTNEEHYIESIYELVQDGITPADIIIRNFNGIWCGDINKFIEYSRI